jgi:hypothetical protein
MSCTLFVDLPATTRQRQVTITAKGDDGKTLLTDRGDLASIPERQKIARRLAKRLEEVGISIAVEHLEAKLETAWVEAIDERGRQETTISADDEAGDYLDTPGGLVWMKSTDSGPVPVRLANFTAKIVADVAQDDGA